MYSLLIHLVAFSQIIVLYGITAPTNFRLLHQTFLDKNRQWVNDNDAFAQKYTSPKYSIVLSYMIGMGWLVYLGYSALAHASESTLFAFLFWSLLAWGVFCGMFGCVEYHRVWKTIPLPIMRSASLEPRTLRDYVHPWWVYVCYAIMALIAAVYIQAVRLGRIDNATFTARMTGLSIGLIFGTLALFYGIRRKRQPLDDAWGPSYRKLEICFYVFVLYLLALVGVNCVLEDIFAISFFSDITFVIAVSLIIQAFSLWFSKHHSTKELLVDALH